MQLMANFLRDTPFKKQLSMAVTAGVVCIALFSSMVNSWQASSQIRATLLEQGQRVAENLANNSTLALLYDSPENANNAVQTTLAFPDVTGIEIRHIDGRLLIGKGRTENESVDKGVPSVLKMKSTLEKETGNYWRFVAPVIRMSVDSPFEVIKTGDEILGYVRVTQSKETLQKTITRVFLANVLISFFFAFIFLIVIRFLANRLTKPIYALSEAMTRAERGETNVYAKLGGPKDISDMAQAFNQMIGVIQDREAQLKKLNSELEERVQARTAELESANHELSISNQELEAFSYSVSHDLRAPLRAISGFSEIITENNLHHLDDQGKKLFSRIQAAAQRMGDLIDGLLHMARTGRGSMERTTVDMSAIAREILNDLMEAEPARNVEIYINPNLTAYADGSLVRIVLNNLLGNAWKFTSLSENPTIIFDSLTLNNEHVFFVRDNGAGFDMNHVESLFQPFRRLANANNYQGTGIGLATVYRIIRRHGGKIWPEAYLGKGATFYFTLTGNHDD